jgi:hypothetical protein
VSTLNPGGRANSLRKLHYCKVNLDKVGDTAAEEEEFPSVQALDPAQVAAKMASEIQNTNGQVTTNEHLLEVISKLQHRQQELETRLKELEKQQVTVGKQNGNGGDPDNSELVGAIDQGTTSSRFLIFNRHGEPVAQHQEEFRQIYPNPG